MNGWAIIGIIVSILTLAGSILFHLFKTTWWMATLTSSLDALKTCVEKIEEKIIKHEGTYCSKDYVDKELGRIQNTADAAHRRLDELNDNHKR